MAANFLGAFGPQVISQLSETFGMEEMPQQPAKKKPGGFLNTLGQIGDVLAMFGDEQPVYQELQNRKAKAEQAEAAKNALGAWLANPDDQMAFQRALMADPDRALGLRKDMQGEAYTLGEGQVRYQGGKQIARGPDKLDTVEIDGVVFDKRSGQPLFESPYNRVIPGQDGEFFEQPRIGIGRSGGGQRQQSPQMAPDDAAPILQRAAQSKVISPEDAERVRASLGPDAQGAYEQWLRTNGIAIGKTMGGQTFYQVNGRWYDNPEGR
jgi:hypothetical protein